MYIYIYMYIYMYIYIVAAWRSEPIGEDLRTRTAVY